MKNQPLAQASIADFFYWIRERHAIFVRRQSGQPKPWTADRILQTYKFTNPFRRNDRGTVWLTENFIKPHWNDPLDLIAFNICWYRMFNWTGTGELLGWQTEWDAKKVETALDWALNGEGKQVFTGAHIVYSPPGVPKVEAIVDVCTDLWKLRHGVVNAAETLKLQTVFELLTTVECVGGFMGYEMVTDMRWTRLFEPEPLDHMTWANTGPGALRGLRRLFGPSVTMRTSLPLMRELLSYTETDEYLPQGFPPLELRDIEHSLCEFDKYWRVKSGEGEPRSKYPGGVTVWR